MAVNLNMEVKDRQDIFVCEEHDKGCIFLENLELFDWMKIESSEERVLPHTPQGENLMKVNFCQYCGKDVSGISVTP